MIEPLINNNEKQRLEALDQYGILDTLPEEEYDEITALASEITNMPIALVSLVDGKRQWFKSKVGLSAEETPKEISFCGHAINNPDSVFIIPDSRKDERFHDNPLVVNDPNVIFYAGVPLVVDNYPLGTLCVIDNKPNQLTDTQIKSLKVLSKQVVKLLELRLKNKKLENDILLIKEHNKVLKKFADLVIPNIKNPVKNLTNLIDMFSDDYKSTLNKDGQLLFEKIDISSKQLNEVISITLSYKNNRELFFDTLNKKK